MPPVAAVVGAAAAAAGAIISGASVAAALATAGLQLAVGLASTLLSKDRDSSNLSTFAVRARDRTQQFRQPITARRVVYGSARVSGPLVFIDSTESNKLLHLVIALATHQVAGIGTVYFNDDPIYSTDLDGSGNVTSGKYSGLVRIKKHFGTAAQTADSDLVSESSLWTTDHRLRGIAYIYVRLQFDQNVFPSSVPNISVEMKGRNQITDTRDLSTGFTDNSALVIRDYLTNFYDGGRGNSWPTSDIDDTFTDASANICDEFVTTKSDAHTATTVDFANDVIEVNGEVLKFQLGDRVQVSSTGAIPGGLAASTNYYVIPDRTVERETTDDAALSLATSLGNARAGTAITLTDAGSGAITITKNAEPRYVAAGVIDLDSEPGSILEDLATSLGKTPINIGGTWQIRAAAYTAPTVELNEDDLRGPISIQTRLSRRERFNAIQGIYVSPLNGGQAASYPIVTDSTAQTNDGGPIVRDFDLPFTPRSNMAQRLAKIQLQQARFEINGTARFSLNALRAQGGGTVGLTNTRYGWNNKPFEITDFKLVPEEVDDVPIILPELEFRETAPSIYSFDSSTEEQQPANIARTSLPNPFTVTQPTSVRLSTKRYTTDSNTVIAAILVEWDQHPDFYVVNGGKIIIQTKRAEETDWLQSWEVEGDQVMATSPPAQDGVLYDVRIKAQNHLRVESDFVTIVNFQMGAAGGGAINQFDYRFFAETVDTNLDYGAFSAAADTTIDYGSFSA